MFSKINEIINFEIIIILINVKSSQICYWQKQTHGHHQVTVVDKTYSHCIRKEWYKVNRTTTKNIELSQE
jgi:hypothetical protein